MDSFTNMKDVDREILLKMSDRDILKTCSLNKYFSKKVCDDDFFRRLFQARYPRLVKEKPSYRNWKQHYLKTIYAIDKLKDVGVVYTEKARFDPEYYLLRFNTDNIDESLARRDITRLLKAIFDAIELRSKTMLDFLLRRYDYITSARYILEIYKKGEEFYQYSSGREFLNVTYSRNKEMEEYLTDKAAKEIEGPGVRRQISMIQQY